MTALVSIPGLMILTATRLRNGVVCSARYTIPKPPSPNVERILYRPTCIGGGGDGAGGAATVGAGSGRVVNSFSSDITPYPEMKRIARGLSALAGRLSSQILPRRLLDLPVGKERR